MFCQRTIKENIKLNGVGLHSGEHVTMVICPAPPDTGIVFLTGGKRIKAVCDNVGDTSYATTLQDGDTKVRRSHSGLIHWSCRECGRRAFA